MKNLENDSSNFNPKIVSEYVHPEKRETITLDIEKELNGFIAFYKKHNIEINDDFEKVIKKIWQDNQEEIRQIVKEKGFNKILIIPGGIPLSEFAEKMKMKDGYEEGDHFKSEGSFVSAKSPDSEKTHIILTYDVLELSDRPELGKTVGNNSYMTVANTMSLEDYLVFAKQRFEIDGGHLDEESTTYTKTNFKDTSFVAVCGHSLSSWDKKDIISLYTVAKSDTTQKEPKSYGFRLSCIFYEK